MSKRIDFDRFDQLSRNAEKYNAKHGRKRFYTIQSRNGKILVFGLYDYLTKKYIISEPFQDVNEIFDEMENLLSSV